MIPYGRQDITSADIEAVTEVLKSDWLTQGPKVEQFETAIANKVGAQHAVAVNSATSALHIACLALGLGKDDRLWTSPNTFVASANCALYCGATVDFVDIDPHTYNISLEQLKLKLAAAEKTGTLPKILVVVHHSGQACPMQKISKLAATYNIRVIEDASHAIGGQYQGEYVGNCRFSDITIFSLHPVKIITTGEGGLALTNNSELAAAMVRLRSHGVTRDERFMERRNDEPWYYEQIELGFNYRITDIQAALGLSQLGRLDTYVARRNELAVRYDRLLQSLPLSIPAQTEDCRSARHLYAIRLDLKALNRTRREVFEHLRALGIGVNVHYIPVHTQPVYQRLGFNLGDFPEAEQYYAEAISLPLFATMTEAQSDEVVTALKIAIDHV